MMFSSYFTLSCILGIAINLYGNYLLERYKLEEKYPRVAVFIKYRRKATKYYIISNIIFIILTCIMNIFYGITILSIIYTYKKQQTKI